MASPSLKNDLLQRLQQVDDPALLEQVQALLDLHTSRRWEDLPQALRTSVLEGYKQSERGEGRPHEAVMRAARWRRSNGSTRM